MQVLQKLPVQPKEMALSIEKDKLSIEEKHNIKRKLIWIRTDLLIHREFFYFHRCALGFIGLLKRRHSKNKPLPQGLHQIGPLSSSSFKEISQQLWYHIHLTLKHNVLWSISKLRIEEILPLLKVSKKSKADERETQTSVGGRKADSRILATGDLACSP